MRIGGCECLVRGPNKSCFRPTIFQLIGGNINCRPTTEMLYLMILTYFLKIKDSNEVQSGSANVIISQNIADSSNITIAII